MPSQYEEERAWEGSNHTQYEVNIYFNTIDYAFQMYI